MDNFGSKSPIVRRPFRFNDLRM